MKEQLYLETKVSGVRLEAGLLQVRDRMQFHKDKVQNNSVLYPTAFTSRSLTSSETCCTTLKEKL